jgi:hypothetical protein
MIVGWNIEEPEFTPLSDHLALHDPEVGVLRDSYG